jgi:DNA-binding helix-hairpin-helix protein with protein kinase domain
MSGELLFPGDEVTTLRTHHVCRVVDFIGGGGQGEVYQATLGGDPIAVKWYFPTALSEWQRGALEKLTARPAPSRAFLWPLDVVVSEKSPAFGYVMALRPDSFEGLNAILRREAELPLTTLAVLGANLADAFLRLHTEGLCYRDISPRNIFFNPQNGDILICDNDNVSIDGTIGGGVLGTPRYMAPEIVRREAMPSSRTDLWSLSVLLFCLLILHHPLEGRRELTVPSLSDLAAARQLYGDEPVFIFDPDNDSNRPDPTAHANALLLWPFYPEFVQELFTRAFTDGIKDPSHGRVGESEWRAALSRLRDCVARCASCSASSYVDPRAAGAPVVCWNCQTALQPAYLDLSTGAALVVSEEAQLLRHHVELGSPYGFSEVVGVMRPHPSRAGYLGLANRSTRPWQTMRAGREPVEVPPGATVGLSAGTVIDFGSSRGTVRASAN